MRKCCLGPAIAGLAGLLVAAALGAAEPPARIYDFDADVAGSPPAGFELARTGRGAEGSWVVRSENPSSMGKANHVLVQESKDPTDYRFPLCVATEGRYQDVTLAVRAKPLSGEVDQGFGLVWRYRDADNYYLTRCNADEDNCTIYHVVKGVRRAFQNHPIKVATKTWHTLKLDARGHHFVVWFDGTQVLDAIDDTFKAPGRVGLWTKADSVIQFDDFTVQGH
jgi:hypothetical protein